MNAVFSLSGGIMKNFTREKAIIFLLVLFPFLLIVMAVASAPESSLFLEIDGTIVSPPPSGEVVAVLLNSMTSIVLVTSITSFFLSFQLRAITPRLRVLGYSSFRITFAFIFIIVIISIFTTLAVIGIGSPWITPNNWLGYFTALFLGGIIFSTLGLLVAEIVDTKELGLYLILTLGVIDTAFLENPIYSKRYNDPGLALMPSHESIKMLLRSVFDLDISWLVNLPDILLYEIALIVIYLLLKRKK
ncbi:MAG: hypothetical protein ACW99F_08335 [Candidatus Hodarchaeales archaeon]|jgi:hypothetical protein